MMIAITFHHHGEAEGVAPVVYCQDCAHHVHHDGHLLAFQHTMHDCVLCQLQSTPYLSPTVMLWIAIIVFHHITRKNVCAKCKLTANDVKNTRAPPYSLLLLNFAKSCK